MRDNRLKGLAFQSWLYIVMFAFFILALLWGLQVLFLNTFYQNMKTREIVKIGQRLTRAYYSEQFMEIAGDYAFSNALMVMLFDDEGNLVASPNDYVIAFERMPLRIFEDEFIKLRKEMGNRGLDEVYFTTGDERRQTVVYASALEDGEESLKYLVITSMLPPIDSTAVVLQVQLRIVTFIVLAVSLIVGRMLSRKLSVPIIELTKSAKKLANGDLNVQFHGGGYEEIIELADTLNYATEEISKTDRYQKEFIANVSHDLRTPLTLIKIYGEMIRDVYGNDSGKRTEACDTIINETDWLTGMVNELLELSKLQLSGEKPDMSEFDISACLRGILETVGVLAERDGYKLEFEVEDEAYVIGNEQGLKRAMYNLIGNALNYTGEDKRVSVRLIAAGDGVRFEVSDSGSGVSEDDMQKVWERYYKSHETHRRAVIGTGVGLSIVKTVLEQHNAGYGVENLSEGGAMFWFTL